LLLQQQEDGTADRPTAEQQQFQSKLLEKHQKQQQHATAMSSGGQKAPRGWSSSQAASSLRTAAPLPPAPPPASRTTTITGEVPTWSDAPRCMGVCLYAAQGNARFEAWNACARAAFKGPEELQASGLGQCGALPAAGVAKAAAVALKTGGTAARGASRLFGGGGSAASEAAEAVGEAAAQAAAEALGGAAAGGGGSSAAGSALSALSQAAAAGAAALSNPALLTLLRVPAISEAAELANPLCGAPRANLTALAVEPAAALLMPPLAAVVAGAEEEEVEAVAATPLVLQDEPNFFAPEKPSTADSDLDAPEPSSFYGGLASMDEAAAAAAGGSFAAVGVGAAPVAAGAKAAAPQAKPAAAAAAAAAPAAPAVTPLQLQQQLQGVDPKVAQTETVKARVNRQERTFPAAAPAPQPPRKQQKPPSARRAAKKDSPAGIAAAPAPATPEAPVPSDLLSDESVMVADPRALGKGGAGAVGRRLRRRSRLLMGMVQEEKVPGAAAAAADNSWIGALAGALRTVTGGAANGGDATTTWETLPPSASGQGPTLVSVDNSPLEELMASEGQQKVKTVKAPKFTPELGAGSAAGVAAAGPADADDEDDDDDDDRQLALQEATASAGRGHWHIVKGLNPTFDCFPCQQYVFTQPPEYSGALGDGEDDRRGAAAGLDGDDADPLSSNPHFTYRPGDPLQATYVIGWGDGERAAMRAAARTGKQAAAGWRGANVQGRGAFVTRVDVALRPASARDGPKPISAGEAAESRSSSTTTTASGARRSEGRRNLMAASEEQEEARQKQQPKQRQPRRNRSSSSSARDAAANPKDVADLPNLPRTPATMPSPGQWQAEYHVSGMPGDDRWFVVDAVGEDFVLVLYCAEVGLPCQRGGFVLASPAAVRRQMTANSAAGGKSGGKSSSSNGSALLPADVSARFDAAIRRSGWAEAYGQERVRMSAWCDVPVCPGVPLL
jgi:hypothetical protein